MNGGSCVFHNMCQCSRDFRGAHCQYSVDRCSIKNTNFNGGFRCSGSASEMSCTLNCPDGIDFEFPPATAYVCKFKTGKFTPERIPQCVYGKEASTNYVELLLCILSSLSSVTKFNIFFSKSFNPSSSSVSEHDAIC